MLCHIISAAVLAVSARSREQMRSPEYQELAAMFAQEVDAEKTGMHVDKRRSSELVQKALVSMESLATWCRAQDSERDA